VILKENAKYSKIISIISHQETESPPIFLVIEISNTATIQMIICCVLI